MKLRPSRYELVSDDGTVLLELPLTEAMQAAQAFQVAFPVVDPLPAETPLRGFEGHLAVPPTTATDASG